MSTGWFMKEEAVQRQLFTTNTGWWFGTFGFFPYIGNNRPN